MAGAVSAQQTGNDVTVIGNPDTINTNRTAELSGTVTDARSGNPIAGATVFIEELRSGTSTDSSGRYQLQVPIGQHLLRSA